MELEALKSCFRFNFSITLWFKFGVVLSSIACIVKCRMAGLKKILKTSRPKMDPRGFLQKKKFYKLYALPSLTLCFLFERYC